MHVLEKFRYCPVCGSSSFEEQDEKSKRYKRCGFEYYLNPSAAVAAFVLNSKGQLLTLRRSKAPAKGTLDLPGGFADIGETIDEALIREVKEETGLTVTEFEFFTTLPNRYEYSGFVVPTLDSFFICKVSNETELQANDDAEEALWLDLEEVHTEEFGLRSIRHALSTFLQKYRR